MTDDLRMAIGIFDEYAGREESSFTISNKSRLEILCQGYAAAARGWRFIATGQGIEAEIITALEDASLQLIGAERQRRGPPTHLMVVPEPGDDTVIRRYYEREPESLTLRQFVEAAFDAGELDKDKTIDVHVNRLRRRIIRETG